MAHDDINVLDYEEDEEDLDPRIHPNSIFISKDKVKHHSKKHKRRRDRKVKKDETVVLDKPTVFLVDKISANLATKVNSKI